VNSGAPELSVLVVHLDPHWVPGPWIDSAVELCVPALAGPAASSMTNLSGSRTESSWPASTSSDQSIEQRAHAPQLLHTSTHPGAPAVTGTDVTPALLAHPVTATGSAPRRDRLRHAERRARRSRRRHPRGPPAGRRTSTPRADRQGAWRSGNIRKCLTVRVRSRASMATAVAAMARSALSMLWWLASRWRSRAPASSAISRGLPGRSRAFALQTRAGAQLIRPGSAVEIVAVLGAEGSAHRSGVVLGGQRDLSPLHEVGLHHLLLSALEPFESLPYVTGIRVRSPSVHQIAPPSTRHRWRDPPRCRVRVALEIRWRSRGSSKTESFCRRPW
jgi:hypothetical protein